MEFQRVIAKRSMIRAFKPDALEDRHLQRLLYNAWKAPSAGFTQPVEYVIVKKDETKRKLAEAALNQECITAAPVVIVVCADTKRSAARYGARGVNFYSIIDGAFASLNLMLTAVDENLGCCFIGAFHDDEVSRVLGLPRHIRPIGIIAVGHPDEKPTKLSRIPLERLIHHETW